MNVKFNHRPDSQDLYFDMNGEFALEFWKLTEFPIFRSTKRGAWYITHDLTEPWKYVHPHQQHLVSDYIRGLNALLRM